MIKLFSGEALRIGWSVWWRAWVPFLVAAALVLLLAFVLGQFQAGGGSGSPSVLAMLFPVMVVLCLNVGLIFWLDKASKVVALKRYQIEMTRFVGWKMFYRIFLELLTALSKSYSVA